MSVSTPTAPTGAAPTGRLRALAAGREGLVPGLLLVALMAITAYAAFADGATSVPNETRVQVALAAVAALALGGLLFASRRPHAPPALRAAAPPVAWAGLGLLGLFAVWNGLSLAWSIGPDLTWTDLNRTIAYALAAGLALVVGSSLPRAAERAAMAYLAVATLIALYALGGKALPWFEIPGVIDLNHTADFSRLRDPLGYWNALALVCVLAVPIALRAASDFERGRRSRLASQLAVVPLVVTIGLTYSRGGLISLAVALLVLVAFAPDRLRLAALAGVAVLGSVPALVVGFTSDDLTRDGISIASRTDDGFAMLAMLGLGTALTVAAAAYLRRRDEFLVVTAEARRYLKRGTLIAGGIALLILANGLQSSERGARGSISHQWDKFTSTQAEKTNDPARILKTNSGNRWVWWKEAAGAWADEPLTGHGAGTFPLVHLGYREDTLTVRDVHSVPLQFLAETGLIGALLALGGLGLLALAGARRVWRSFGGERSYAVALAASASAYGVHMWIDWDWDIPAVTLPVLIFLGVLAARPPGGGGAEVRPLAPRRESPGRGVALALGAALAAAFAVSAVLPALARDRTSEAFARAAGGTVEDLVDGARAAEIGRRLNPLSAEPSAAAAAIADRRGRYERAAELLAEGVERQPNDPQSWLRVATFNVRRDDVREAIVAAREVGRLDPRGTQLGTLLFPALDPSIRSATVTGTPLPEAAPPVPPPG